MLTLPDYTTPRPRVYNYCCENLRAHEHFVQFQETNFGGQTSPCTACTEILNRSMLLPAALSGTSELNVPYRPVALISYKHEQRYSAFCSCTPEMWGYAIA
jgi:hypothetical protein